MGYLCIKSNMACDGCGDCRGEWSPCPECGNTTYEALYWIDNTVVGCDACVKKQWVL